ncbi:hypothetical protein Tco_0688203 [Tanacetum coccineum]
MQEWPEQLQELQDKGKANVVTDALSRKERVKPRRVRAMAMTIQYGVSLVGSEMDEAHASRVVVYIRERIRSTLNRGDMLCHPQSEDKGTYELGPLEDLIEEHVSPVLWAEIRESSLIGHELVLEMTDKVVLIKEKLKAAEDHQRAMLILGKKGTKLAPRYVEPFEILERSGIVAYRLRLPEELNSVHDTFHV